MDKRIKIGIAVAILGSLAFFNNAYNGTKDRLNEAAAQLMLLRADTKREIEQTRDQSYPVCMAQRAGCYREAFSSPEKVLGTVEAHQRQPYEDLLIRISMRAPLNYHAGISEGSEELRLLVNQGNALFVCEGLSYGCARGIENMVEELSSQSLRAQRDLVRSVLCSDDPLTNINLAARSAMDFGNKPRGSLASTVSNLLSNKEGYCN